MLRELRPLDLFAPDGVHQVVHGDPSQLWELDAAAVQVDDYMSH